MDGVSDGVECYDEGTVEYLNGTTKEGGLDPLNPDTDKDGIPDGQEYHGHKFTYFKMSPVDGDGSDSKEINPGNPGDVGLNSDGRSENYEFDQSETGTDQTSGDSTTGGDSEDSEEIEFPSKEKRFIDSLDPLVAYKNREEGEEWTDIDGDNIPDSVEQNPDMIGSNRFDDIPWIESIRKFKDEFNDTGDEEDERLYNKTFNAFCRDEGKPILKKLKVEANADLELNWNDMVSGDTWGEVKIKVYDPSGIDHIRLSNDHESRSISISPSYLDDDGVIEKTIDIDTVGTDWRDGWDLKVRVADEAAFMARAFVEWAKDKAFSMFSIVVDSIVKGLQGWVETIQSKMNNFFTRLSDWNDGDGNLDATMQAGTGFMLLFMKQEDKAEQVTEAFQFVINFIAPLNKYISLFDRYVIYLNNILSNCNHNQQIDNH